MSVHGKPRWPEATRAHLCCLSPGPLLHGWLVGLEPCCQHGPRQPSPTPPSPLGVVLSTEYVHQTRACTSLAAGAGSALAAGQGGQPSQGSLATAAESHPQLGRHIALPACPDTTHPSCSGRRRPLERKHTLRRLHTDRGSQLG
eukprot:scaffold1320_cov113-Isochrysis_galbana.AAC.6